MKIIGVIVVILWKESLKSGGQQYTKKRKRKGILTSHLNWLSTKKITTYEFENPGSGLGQAYKYVLVNTINGIATFPFDNSISKGNTYSLIYIYSYN